MDNASGPDTGNNTRSLTTSHNLTSFTTTSSEPLAKPRSCAVCAQRKVRCDKRYPCSRCQRAGIPCVPPLIDHRPRWAHHRVPPPGSNARALSGHSTPGGIRSDSVLDRLKLLEGLVRDLRGELEHGRATSTAAASHSGSELSGNTSTTTAAILQPGHVILDDSDRVRNVSSVFWSHIDSELDSLKEDTLGYENDRVGRDVEGARPQSKSSSIAEANRSPYDRHAFLLKYNLSFAKNDTSKMLPLTSQIPFLVEVFSERVHNIIGLPYMPSLKKLLQHHRSGRIESRPPDEEALMFSVFYAAICSLDEDEVTRSFNLAKDELVLKYRIGLEHALAEADFLNNPTDILMQSFVIFLALARRHDSPKYVWMMTGLVIRMAHYLGLHHDGSASKHLIPFQVEMQRRIWWNLCVLDMRATDDQGTELAIPHGSYSTRMPSNINNADIWPEMEHPPSERQGPTDLSMFRMCSKVTRHTQEMMAASATATFNDQTHRLNELTQELDCEYFSLVDESQDQIYLAAAGFVRLALGRLTILAFLPVLYSSPSVNFSGEMRTKLLVAAIDVLEHNHALNSDARCQPWKWVYQTQLHWHAIVYLLIEICRRPWSSTIERAWVALHSPWLVPARAPSDKNFSVLIPLRRLMARARKHRESEIPRLRNDSDAAANVEKEDRQQIPIPTSSTTFPAWFNDEMYHRQWHQLINPGVSTTTSTLSGISPTASDLRGTTNINMDSESSLHVHNVPETAPVSHDYQPPFAAPLNYGVSMPLSEPWRGATEDFTDCRNLDTFLGTNTNMELIDIMDDHELLNFDWNSWVESARGSL